MSSLHRRAIEFLLAAMSTHVGEDGLLHQFNISGRRQISGIGVSIYFSRKALVTAALFVREHGASYLRALSVTEVATLLTDFIKDNYAPVSNDTLFKHLDGPFSRYISVTGKDQLAEALAQSPVFRPELELTIFPLVALRVADDFSCASFFFRKPEALPQEMPEWNQKLLMPNSFPPVIASEWKYRRETPAAWLGVRAHGLASARKMLRAILGAVALTPSHTYRYMFSGRSMWGGHLIAGISTYSLSFGDAHTPPLMEDIVLGVADQNWLKILGNKISEESRIIRRQMTALEYYYRAWPLGPSERFPILCMALDATYSEIAGTTAAVVDGIQSTLGPLDSGRLRALLEIRASVIHGGAPDVYDSRKYGKYFRTYGEDPIADLGLLVAACLRQKIFDGALNEHGEPHQNILQEARAKGRMPKNDFRSSILDLRT